MFKLKIVQKSIYALNIQQKTWAHEVSFDFMEWWTQYA